MTKYIAEYQGLAFKCKSFEESRPLHSDLEMITVITDDYIDPIFLERLERDMFYNKGCKSLDDYKFDKFLSITNLAISKTQTFLNIDITGFSLPSEKEHIKLIEKAMYRPSKEGELVFICKN